MLGPQLSSKPNVRKVSGKVQPRIESKNQSVQPPASIQTTKQQSPHKRGQRHTNSGLQQVGEKIGAATGVVKASTDP